MSSRFSFDGTDSTTCGNMSTVHPPTPQDGVPPRVPAGPQPTAPPRRDFLAVYDEMFPFVWRVARRLGVPEASLDDVCQDVFVAVHKQLPEFEGRSSLKTWVYGILHNVVLMRRRSSRRKDPNRAEIDPDVLTHAAPDPLDAASGAQAVRIAHALLSQLADDRRTLFVLVELEGMSVPEAAEATQTNLNTAYARLRAARADFAAAVARFQAKERRSP
jgi:RNA polymerase sigma-70 factor (ECF subfamily)